VTSKDIAALKLGEGMMEMAETVRSTGVQAFSSSSFTVSMASGVDECFYVLLTNSEELHKIMLGAGAKLTEESVEIPMRAGGGESEKKWN